jgi:hypothetical protein
MNPISTVFAQIEASQTAKQNGASQLATDQAKVAAINAAVAQDTQSLNDLTTQADADVNAGIAALQALLSTAVPVVVPVPAV